MILAFVCFVEGGREIMAIHRPQRPYFFGESKVNDFAPSLAVDDDVLEFEIPVDDFL